MTDRLVRITYNTCTHCGKIFATTDPETKFCSERCRKASEAQDTAPVEVLSKHEIENYKSSVRQCMYCAEEFTPLDPNQLYCSVECSEKAKAEEDAKERETLRELLGLSYENGISDEEREKARFQTQCARLGITAQHAETLGIADNLSDFVLNEGAVRNKQVIAALDGDFTEGGYILCICKDCGEPFISESPKRKHCVTCARKIEDANEQKKLKAKQAEEAEKAREKKKIEAETKKTAEKAGADEAAENAAEAKTEAPELQCEPITVNTPSEEPEEKGLERPQEAAEARRSTKRSDFPPVNEKLMEELLADSAAMDSSDALINEMRKAMMEETLHGERAEKVKARVTDVGIEEIAPNPFKEKDDVYRAIKELSEKAQNAVYQNMEIIAEIRGKEPGGDEKMAKKEYIPCKYFREDGKTKRCTFLNSEVKGAVEERCCEDGCPIYEAIDEEEIARRKEVENRYLLQSIAYFYDISDALCKKVGHTYTTDQKKMRAEIEALKSDIISTL